MEVEPYLGGLIDYIGEERILFACDYPHPDHEPDMPAQVVELESIVTNRYLRRFSLITGAFTARPDQYRQARRDTLMRVPVGGN